MVTTNKTSVGLPTNNNNKKNKSSKGLLPLRDEPTVTGRVFYYHSNWLGWVYLIGLLLLLDGSVDGFTTPIGCVCWVGLLLLLDGSVGWVYYYFWLGLLDGLTTNTGWVY